ncbi:HNH endonuclease [Deinococcus sp.]|uniref:HNH endonuclease n=1 Tax=Deinococcus sp. TaxID=47478 RepID=UPI0025F25245|nr:HNH endonuclease [Deinococcus sp.]
MARRLPLSDWPNSNWPPAPQPDPFCGLCGRETPRLTEHHLIPRSQGRRRGVKIAELPTVLLCPACHSLLHKTFSNAELAGDFSSVGALLGQPDVRKFVAWIRRQPASKGVRVR